jgi:hypothetical protein
LIIKLHQSLSKVFIITMELKRFWLPYATNENVGSKDGQITAEIIPADFKDTELAEKELQSLLNLGWEIVSTAPITGSVCKFMPKFNYTNVLTFTSGLEIFLIKK